MLFNIAAGKERAPEQMNLATLSTDGGQFLVGLSIDLPKAEKRL